MLAPIYVGGTSKFVGNFYRTVHWLVLEELITAPYRTECKKCQNITVGKVFVCVCQYEQKAGVSTVRSVLLQVCNEALEFRLTREK